MFKEQENKKQTNKQRCPRRMQNGDNHIHFGRYIVGYVRKSSLIAPLERRSTV